MNDELYKHLGSLGYTGSINDRMSKKLKNDGLSGSLNDMLSYEKGSGSEWKWGRFQVALGTEEGPTELVPSLDFTEWSLTGGMQEATTNMFTNIATSGIGKDIGAEVGKTYTVTVNSVLAGGAVRCYLTDSVTTVAPETVFQLSGGVETFTLPAYGAYFVFRISIDSTVTTILSLSVQETT